MQRWHDVALLAAVAAAGHCRRAMALSLAHRNVLILATCQAIVWSSASVMITSSALAAKLLADESLATLPLGLHFTATMLSTFVASLLMRRIGRRAGFTVGALFGIACGVLSSWAIFASGGLHSWLGWAAVNLAGAAPLAAVILGILWLRRRHWRIAPAAAQ